MSLYKFCIIFFHSLKLKISDFHIPAFPVVSIFLWDAYLLYINYDHLIYLADLCWAFESSPLLLLSQHNPPCPSKACSAIELFPGTLCMVWTDGGRSSLYVPWFSCLLNYPKCSPPILYSVFPVISLDIRLHHPSWFWTLSKIIFRSSICIFLNPETHGRFLCLNDAFWLIF